MNKLERDAMQRHEDLMALPVRVLFPRPQGFSRVINCKGCGVDFTWTPSSGKIRMYCTSTCKTNAQRQP
jgi:hypothetical protein